MGIIIKIQPWIRNVFHNTVLPYRTIMGRKDSMISLFRFAPAVSGRGLRDFDRV